MAEGRVKSWLATLVVLVVAFAVVVLLALLFAIWVIGTFVPALGPVLVITSVSVVMSVVSGSASVVLAFVARSTFRETRRKTRRDFVFEQMRGLYSPLYHIVEESEGNIYQICEAPPGGSSLAEIQTYWYDRIIPLMRQGLHLASPELFKLYRRMMHSEPSEALAKELSDRVRADYERLTAELHQMPI